MNIVQDLQFSIEAELEYSQSITGRGNISDPTAQFGVLVMLEYWRKHFLRTIIGISLAIEDVAGGKGGLLGHRGSSLRHASLKQERGCLASISARFSTG